MAWPACLWLSCWVAWHGLYSFCRGLACLLGGAGGLVGQAAHGLGGLGLQNVIHLRKGPNQNGPLAWLAGLPRWLAWLAYLAWLACLACWPGLAGLPGYLAVLAWLAGLPGWLAGCPRLARLRGPPVKIYMY